MALGNTMATGRSNSTGDQLLPTGLEVPLGANWTGVGATGDGAVVLPFTEHVEVQEGPPRSLGGPQVQHKFTHGGRGSREAVYASMAALYASPVVWLEVAVFTDWTVLLKCCRARGHDSAHVAK